MKRDNNNRKEGLKIKDRKKEKVMALIFTYSKKEKSRS